MHIQSLRLRVTDAHVHAMLAEFRPDGGPVEDLRVRLTAEGVVVEGAYRVLMMKLAFETVWAVTAAGPALVVQLANVNVFGLPAGVLRRALLGKIRDATASQPAIRVADNCLRVNLEELAQSRGAPLQINLTRVASGDGWLTVEAA
jgi:hypothetical protein